ncbi:DUF885 family protein [Phenylobacterium sp.]|uniref:DUF885 domain-containing protein n=1 Tax=Phenylobacterium sp. TaxID=1871053 RepID=UPI0035B2AECA
MNIDRRRLLLSAAAAGLAGALPRLALAADGPVADPKLAALLDAFVDEMLAESPETATSLGLDVGARAGLKSQLSDASAAGRSAQVAAYAARRERLKAIDRGGLNAHDTTTYDTVVAAQELGAAGGEFSYGIDYANPYVVSQQNGAVSFVPEFLNSQHGINAKADADAYLSRLSAFAEVLDQENARIAADAAAGVVPPDFILATTLSQVEALRGQPAGDTRLVGSLVERAKAKGIEGDYATPASRIVADKVFPALDRQIAALKAIQPQAGHDAGVWRLPKGGDYYGWSLKVGTTTNLSAAEIHQMGLDQGAAIDAQMDAILKSQGMTQGTVGERMGALTKDPRFVYPNTDAGRAELLTYLRGRLAAIRPYMSKLSKLNLKAPVEVRPVPKEIEAGAALGYMNFASLDGSRPAIYYVNLADTGNWPRYTLSSLTMHEAIPGHAWQGAYLAERHDEIPTIASLMAFNAFIEGWALYAEQLADEVGLYKDDPFGRLGYFQALRFRAARLVVDTGLHDKRWSREQAIDWMTSATGRSKGAITSEVDRYCASPGQACGYKVGHSEILRLRAKAKQALGPKYDIRDFDDAVVTTGGCPLTVLSTVIDRYIAATKAA